MWGRIVISSRRPWRIMSGVGVPSSPRVASWYACNRPLTVWSSSTLRHPGCGEGTFHIKVCVSRPGGGEMGEERGEEEGKVGKGNVLHVHVTVDPVVPGVRVARHAALVN